MLETDRKNWLEAVLSLCLTRKMSVDKLLRLVFPTLHQRGLCKAVDGVQGVRVRTLRDAAACDSDVPVLPLSSRTDTGEKNPHGKNGDQCVSSPGPRDAWTVSSSWVRRFQMGLDLSQPGHRDTARMGDEIDLFSFKETSK